MFDFENQTRFCNSNQIKNYFGNTIFHFKINSTKKQDYWAINDQAISHTKLDFHLTPQGGFFDPQRVYTSYYKEKNNTFEDSVIIDRQPVFFAVLIPYPILNLFNSGFKNGNEEWGGNSHPFRNQRFSTSLDREKRFSDFRLKTDLKSEIKINNVLGRYDHHNDFFRNNCYPLFIENHDELITIVNDLSLFYKRFLEIDLSLNNISKIVIPFFELTNEEALGLSRSRSDKPIF